MTCLVKPEGELEGGLLVLAAEWIRSVDFLDRHRLFILSYLYLL